MVYEQWHILAKLGNGFQNFNELPYSIFDIRVNGKSIQPTDKWWVDLFIPQKTSELENDGDGTSPFATIADIPVKTSDLINDGDGTGPFALVVNIPTKTSHLTNDGDGTSVFVTLLQLSDYPTISDVTNMINDAMSGGGVSAKFIRIFNSTTDWTGNSEPYTITIPSTTHGCGVNIITDIFILQNANYVKQYGFPSVGYGLNIALNGDVTIRAKERFAGKLVIIG